MIITCRTTVLDKVERASTLSRSHTKDYRRRFLQAQGYLTRLRVDDRASELDDMEAVEHGDRVLESGAPATAMVAALVKLLGSQAVNGLAAKLKIDVALLGASVLVFLIWLGYQWAAIAGQIVMGDVLGDA